MRMDAMQLLRGILQSNHSKIVFLVLDGLGGLPQGGRTELEAARTPNLDALAREAACGLHMPVGYGITPGSGPGHLALFGYDPVRHQIGRGVLEALGLGLELQSTDVAVRCNYATLQDGLIVDRRAGRPPTEETRLLTAALQREIAEIQGVRLHFGPGMEHRFAVVFRFPEPLSPEAAELNDTDPQQTGKPPLALRPRSPQAGRLAQVAEEFVRRAAQVLKGQKRANYVLLRGFATVPHLPSFQQAYGLRALAIATYPMYRGLARLLGMHAPELKGDLKEQLALLRKHYREYDFFFLHVKKVDSFAEDGDFQGKVRKLEEVDALLPELLSLEPDVLLITGDHSTPSVLRAHSWHPVPVLLKGPYVLGGLLEGFSERQCLRGELGLLPSTALMPLALAQAGRLKKFGA